MWECGHGEEAKGCYVRTVRCVHLDTEWVMEQIELIDPETGYYDGKEHLVRYCCTLGPDGFHSYSMLTGEWKDAEKALLDDALFPYWYAQYEERWEHRHGHSS